MGMPISFDHHFFGHSDEINRDGRRNTTIDVHSYDDQFSAEAQYSTSDLAGLDRFDELTDRSCRIHHFDVDVDVDGIGYE
ncbi:hypothetical protein O9K51_06730 [Purpureocillium lavendulum]|uniref:Uncharacterized protein n=1 Tax=Purpureocillium lavendulum TaxID=1247861 RepID=A0AB34FP10_9HYPO|nr:hypothetical protein O9K51_06730 [Purpureocillium lavendulum]